MFGELTTSEAIILVGYFVVAIGLGAMFAGKRGDTEQYLLGGRGMPWWVIGISYLVSLWSTISLVAIPGEAFNYGLGMAVTTILSPIVEIAGFLLFIRFYFKLRSFTPFEYLERRYDARVRALTTVAYWCTRILYVSMVLYASSVIFEAAVGWEPWITIVAVGVISIAYTYLGGIRAVVWTDFMQFIVLAAGLIGVVIVADMKVEGGLMGVLRIASENDRLFEPFMEPGFWWIDPSERLTFWWLLCGVLMGGLFYSSVDQIGIQRLLSTSTYQRAFRSFVTYILIAFPFLLAMWFIGLAVFAYFAQHGGVPEGMQGDGALFIFVRQHLPWPLPVLFLSAMLAAAMSTLDSTINSLSTVATKDIYLRFIRPNASERAQVRVSEWLTVVVGVIGTVAALGILMTSESLKQTVLEIGSIVVAFAQPLTAVFLLAVTNRRVTARIAFWALIVSWIVTVVMVAWYVISKMAGDPISFMLVSTPGFFAVLVIGYTAALIRGMAGLPESAPRGLTLWSAKEKYVDPMNAIQTEQDHDA